jgi:hypothetical protein
MQEEGRSHFYRVDESNVAPATATQVGLLGYTGATRISVGANFMATPYVTFGEMVNRLPGQSGGQMSISYPVSQNVDPHGLSGSGAWTQIEKADGIIWTRESH